MGSDEILQDILNELKRAADNGIAFGPEISGYLDKYSKGLLKGAKDLKAVNDSLDLYNKKLKTGTVRASSLEGVIQTLQESITELDNNYEKSIAQEKLRELKRQYMASKALETVGTTGWDTAKRTITAASQTAQKAISEVAEGGSAFKFTAGILTAGIDTINSGANIAGDALSGFGSMVALGPTPQTKLLGGAMMAAGAAVKFFSTTVAEAAKFGISFLTAEADKLLQSFQAASSAGAVFSGGMTDLYTATTNAQLTLSEMSNVVKNNSEALADSGLTVAGAVRMIGQVGKVMQQEGLRTSLLNLGYTYEEQAEMSAKVLGDMRKTGVAFTDKTVAAATADYAKNLRIIADITGEDAKKKMEEARQAMTDFEFRRKLAEKARELGPERGALLVKNTLESLAAMPPAVQRATKQLYVGGAITEVNAYLSGAAAEARENVALMEQGNLNLKTTTDIRAKYSEQLLNGDNQLASSIGRISNLTGQYADLNKDFTELQTYGYRQSRSAIDQAFRDADGQSKANDGLTQTFVAGQENMRALLKQTQDLAIEGFPLLGTAVTTLTGELNRAIKGLREGEAAALSETVRDVTGKPMSRVKTEDYTSPITGETYTRQSSELSTMERIKNFLRLPEYGQDLKRKAGVAESDLEKKADGGIVNKPVIAGEAGPEAIVPLPNGRSIPVDMDLRPLVEALNDLLDVNKDNRDILEKLFHASV